MRRLALLALVPLVGGCFTKAPLVPANWTVEWRQPDAPSQKLERLALTLRVADVRVRAPYSGSRLAVLRGDGSLAFDPYNVFAASPDLLLLGAAFDALERSGRFAHVVGNASHAHADLDVEITVTRLALDCREAGRRDALVELTLAFVAKGEILAVAHGSSAVPVGDGNYSDGFSRAFSEALLGAALKMTTETAH